MARSWLGCTPKVVLRCKVGVVYFLHSGIHVLHGVACAAAASLGERQCH